jgi:hypothetical protein
MGKIYSYASRVNVWLGTANETSDHCIDFLKELSNPWSLGRHPTIDAWVFDLAMTLHVNTAADAWKALQDIFHRSYFRRRWVVQEVALSAKSIVLCGHKEIPWERFTSALYTLLSGYTGLSETDYEALVSIQMMNILYLQGEARANVLPAEKFEVLELLSSFDKFECSDDKDRVFAFLALGDQVLKLSEITKEGFEPNYELSTTSIYQDFAIRYLRQTNDLDILHCAGTHSARKTTGLATKESHTLPSWVPDWSCRSRYRPLLNTDFSAGIEKYILGHDRLPSVQFQIQQDTLIVNGFIVDTITNKSPSFIGFRTPSQLRPYISSWSSLCPPSRLQPILLLNPLISETERWAGRMDSLSFNIDPYARDEKFRSAINGFKQVLLLETAANDDIDVDINIDTSRHAGNFARFCSATMSGRCIFQTNQGYIGMGSTDIRQGDVLVILKGARTPFVLRRAGEAQQYRVIGDAYVDEFMQFENVIKAKLDEIRLHII